MKELTGKAAVVTGAASGIGRAMATRFADEGMRVLCADVEEPPLHETVNAITSVGGDATAVVCDVSSWSSVVNLRDQCEANYGPADVVCNNAGVAATGSIADTSLRSWEWCLGVNLWGVIHGCRAFVPAMVERGSGYIVNTASVVGLITSASIGAYTVSKHGVVALSEALYAEMVNAGTGVGVSCLCPGFVATNIMDSDRNRPERYLDPNSGFHALDDDTRAAIREIYHQTKPPEEVADLVVNAIRENQFYVLTDHDFDQNIAERHQRIQSRQNPDAEISLATKLLD